LPHDLVAAFRCVEFERFKGGPSYSAEAVAARDTPPFVENILPRVRAPHIGMRERFRVENLEILVNDPYLTAEAKRESPA